MAILIVDDETSTRTALRDLLTQLGHKTVLEARNGEEGLKTAEAEKSRIRMIIADWEMPYMDGITLLDRISGLSDLDLAPFLLITSDLPKARLTELQTKTDRLDAFLIKPFRGTALAQAMNAAQAHRASVRRGVVALSATGKLPDPLATALASRELAALWDAPGVARTTAELEQLVRAGGRRLGMLVIDPELSPEEGAKLAQWLGAFARTPLGSSIPFVYCSREPAKIHPFRTLGQAFLPADADWSSFFKQARARASAGLEIGLLREELKSELQARKSDRAAQVCERILKLDPGDPEAHSVAGDLDASAGRGPSATQHYWAALAANPCQPKPYIRLLDQVSADAAELARAAGEAVAHCPQNLDVLMAAARAWQASGNTERARELAARCLAINPKHAGAETLLASLGPPASGGAPGS